jgi:hypothetical protein
MTGWSAVNARTLSATAAAATVPAVIFRNCLRDKNIVDTSSTFMTLHESSLFAISLSPRIPFWCVDHQWREIHSKTLMAVWTVTLSNHFRSIKKNSLLAYTDRNTAPGLDGEQNLSHYENRVNNFAMSMLSH